MSYVSIDVDIDEFLSNCDSSDIKYIINSLVEDGHLNESAVINKKSKLQLTPGEELHFNNCGKIANSYIQMSTEDIDMIESIAKKY